MVQPADEDGVVGQVDEGARTEGRHHLALAELAGRSATASRAHVLVLSTSMLSRVRTQRLTLGFDVTHRAVGAELPVSLGELGSARGRGSRAAAAWRRRPRSGTGGGCPACRSRGRSGSSRRADPPFVARTSWARCVGVLR